MAIKKGGLGRGLGAILEDNTTKENEKTNLIRLSEIEPNVDQPRKEFDPEELASLADSISEYGVLQPITVRSIGASYQIIAGERRWRAARMAGLSEVPVIVIDADDKKAAEIALVENIQRKDLTPLEEAEAYKTLIEEYDLTQEEVGKRVGKSRSVITNSLRLLELPDAIKSYINNGSISEGHAKVLAGIKDPKILATATNTVIEKQLSVRETERLVKFLTAPKNTGSKASKDGVNYTKLLEKDIQKRLGRTVKIVENGDKSSITIGFTDNEDLEKILKLLCGEDYISNI